MKKSKSFSKNLHFISTSFFILFLFALHVKANTFVVGSCAGEGGYSSIQSAVNAASSGDTIEICSGEYDESIITKNNQNGLIIKAADGEDVTIKSNSDGITLKTFTELGIT